MKHSIINYKNLNLGDRIDAEYFQPDFLKNEELLHNSGSIALNQYCDLTSSAFYPAATDLYKIGEVPFVRCVDCINYYSLTDLQSESFEKIPKYFLNSHNNIKRLKNLDIVITKVGTPCYASIVANLGEVALSRTVLGIYNISGISPYYLLVFLRSKFGFDQLTRQRELTIQYQLTLHRTGRILIYKPKDEKLENFIEKVFLKSQEIYKDSVLNYRKANHILLQELNLVDWNPPHILTFIKNYINTQTSRRIDAEHFQPKYNNIINSIPSRVKLLPLKKYVTYVKGIEVGGDKYTTTGKKFIRVSNLTKYGIEDDKVNFISENLYNDLRQSFEPAQGEILLSKDATPGIAFYLSQQLEGIISSGILRLQFVNEIPPYYLEFVLNSLIVQQQIEKQAGGSIIVHWKPHEILNTLIPRLESDIEIEVNSLVAKSHEQRKLSKKLIEISQLSIEIAIENSEFEAERFIYTEIEKLGININT
jgi:type I restriction enzyme, S subunit